MDKLLFCRYPGLILGLLLLLGSAVFARPGRAFPGYRDYQKAHYYEQNSEDQKAIRYYRSALKKGLKAEMVRAARWRLYYLHLDQKQFFNARLVLPFLSLGERKRIEKNWQREFQHYCAMKPSDLDDIAASMLAMRPANQALQIKRIRPSLLHLRDQDCFWQIVLPYLREYDLHEAGIELARILFQDPELSILWQAHFEAKSGRIEIADQHYGAIIESRETCFTAYLPTWAYTEPMDQNLAQAWAGRGRLARITGNRTLASDYFYKASRLHPLRSQKLYYCSLGAWHAWKAGLDLDFSCLVDFTRAELAAECTASAMYLIKNHDGSKQSEDYAFVLGKYQANRLQCPKQVRKAIQKLLPGLIH